VAEVGLYKPIAGKLLIGFDLFVTSIMAVHCWQVVGRSEWPGGRHGDSDWW
jgi:hypothetical protein